MTEIEFRVGEKVLFSPKKGKARKGVVEGLSPYSGTVIVTLEGDPFPVEVKESQVSSQEGGQNLPNAVHSNDKVPKGAKNKKGKRMTDEAPKLDAKELRDKAKALGIKGWEDMGRKEMAKAIKKAEKKASKNKPEEKTPKKEKAPKSEKSKSKTDTPTKEKTTVAKGTPAKKAAAAKSAKAPAKKSVKKAAAARKAPAKTKAVKPAEKAKKNLPKKAPARKTGTKAKTATKKNIKPEPKPGSDEALGITFAKVKPPKATPKEGVNPFRKSSNLFVIAGLALKGGNRKKLAEQLSKKVKLHPYNKKPAKVDLKDYDKRIMLACQTMRDTYGYGFQSTGRGLDGKILVFVPGGPNDPRKGSKKGSAKKK